jgi:NADH dehydrogenase [ubiquinone] 1 alpha subcomplex assembly factor 2
MRRIVQYPPSTPLSEVSVSPQWHQWLRHTRRDAPSLAEQRQDVVRQENLKVLAAQADERWRLKASLLHAPGPGREKERERGREGGLPMSAAGDGDGHKPSVGVAVRDEARTAVRGEPGDVVQGPGGARGEETTNKGRVPPKIQAPPDGTRHRFNERPDGTKVKQKTHKEDPWKQARGAPSEEWQPTAWDPNSVATKR